MKDNLPIIFVAAFPLLILLALALSDDKGPVQCEKVGHLTICSEVKCGK